MPQFPKGMQQSLAMQGDNDLLLIYRTQKQVHSICFFFLYRKWGMGSQKE